MDKKFVKYVLAGVLAVCVLIMLYSFASLICEVALADDVYAFGASSANEIMHFAKYTEIGLICLLVPAFVSMVLAYFGKHKSMPVIAAATLYATAVVSIVFLALAKNFGESSSAAFTIATAYIQELLQLAIPALIIGVYFTVIAVKVFSKSKPQALNKGETEDESV